MTYHPDAKTLIRHAMQALDDELGVIDAWPYVKRLQEVFWDLRKREEAQTRRIGLDVSVSRPREASVNHARGLRAGIHVVDGGDSAA